MKCGEGPLKHSSHMSSGIYVKIVHLPSPSGIWSIYNDTEKISLAPALRMTRSIKEKLKIFLLICDSFFYSQGSLNHHEILLFLHLAYGTVVNASREQLEALGSNLGGVGFFF